MKNTILLIFTLITATSINGQVGIGTTTPDASAILEIQSSEKGFLPPRMTEQQRDAISNPAEGLIVSCTDCEIEGLQQYINGTWQAMTSSHCSNVGDYGTVVNQATGKEWLDRNLGASQVATSSTDEDSYGDLFQWGRGADGHEKRNSPKTTTQATSWLSGHGPWDGMFIHQNNNWLNDPDATHLWSGTDAENNPCPSGFRVPTNAEWNQERLSWPSNDAAGAFASVLKLPMAGARNLTTGDLVAEGTVGRYWSGTFHDSDARNLFFVSSSASMDSNPRGFGYSVRCVKD